MTELCMAKAIVKLPRKNNRTSSLVVDTTSDYNMAKPHQQEDGFYLVTDKLYIDGLPTSVIENEIMELVATCDPIKIHLNRTNESASGYIQFLSRDMADRAYTLLNGVTFRAGIKLQLKINPPLGDNPEPEAHAGILHIKNLPSHTNNKSLYELFRPFGPMMLCKILVEQGSTYKGTALVQYFNSDNTLDAEHNMNNKQVQDNIITVLPFVSSKRRDSSPIHSPLPPVSSPIRSDASSMVDYTNLYIKNLDLNVKSADLFENFRKFGHIISARVMKNAQTKQSKGFGFVSYSKADEAQKAKADMNGEYILSKPVIVAFHEPKKPRDASPTDTSFNSQRVPQKHQPQQQQQQQQHQHQHQNQTHHQPQQQQQQHQNYPQNHQQQNHQQQSHQHQNHQQQYQQNHSQQNHQHQNHQQQNHQQQNHQQSHSQQNHHPQQTHQQQQQTHQQNHTQHNHHHQQQHHLSPPPPMPSFNSPNNNLFVEQQQQQQQQNGYYQPSRPRDFNDQRYSTSQSKYTSNGYNQSQEYPAVKAYHQPMERNNSRHSNQAYDYRPQSYVSQPKEHISMHHTPLKRDLSGSGSIHPPSLTALASGAFINTAPPYNQPQPVAVRPTFRRRGSVESVVSIMTETSSQSRRHTVTKAVLALEKSNDKHVQDIVDMILTLKKKDLATCLFNKVFLKAKVRQAKYALDIFQEEQQQQQDDDEEEEDVVVAAKPVPSTTKHECYNKKEEAAPRYNTTIVNNVVSLPTRSSRAIPIVAPPPPPPTNTPPPASTVKSQGLDPVLLNDKELGEEIDKFLSTLNGLELHEKKQLLGDRLFPLVKSTGVKQAPKITIKLLDSVPLDELAYSMYDKDKLKYQVTRIVSIISARY